MSANPDVQAALVDARASLAESASNFDANAILRGAQLTVVGGVFILYIYGLVVEVSNAPHWALGDEHQSLPSSRLIPSNLSNGLTALRALQNPEIFKYDHYRQAALAVCAGIVVRLVIQAPIFLVKASLWLLSLVIDFEAATWDDKVVNGLDFIANHVLQLPFFLMSLMRYITPTLDHVFMNSLQWVDYTYAQKHKSDDPAKLRAMYYANLQLYATHGDTSPKKNMVEAISGFLFRFGRKAGISLAVYALSYLPIFGRLVLPAASFYTFRKGVGTVPACFIFGVGVLLHRHYLVVFLQSYFASRTLMRELLQPYFARVRFTPEQKRRFFKDREGVLFGFGIGFYTFLKIPLLGILIYGIAEASTAYLITKITDPPPPPAYAEKFAETQVRWRNKHEFLHLPLAHLDATNVNEKDDSDHGQSTTGAQDDRETPRKRFS